MSKKNRKQSKPLCRKPPKGVEAPGMETHTLPVPVFETKADCIRYLQEGLPQWIDAMGAIFNPSEEPSIAATLFWDLRSAVATVGHVLETGLAPDVWDSIDDKHRSALMEWAAASFEESEYTKDGLVLLRAAQRGLGAEDAARRSAAAAERAAMGAGEREAEEGDDLMASTCPACGKTERDTCDPPGWTVCHIERWSVGTARRANTDETDLTFCSEDCADRWIQQATEWPADNWSASPAEAAHV